MVFRPVWLNVGSDPFAPREFLMGSRAGGDFRENPTKVQLGGSFIRDNGGKKDWLYYIGKYEVTEAQFGAVVSDGGATAVAPAKPAGSRTPKTNVTLPEVYRFLEAYNAWLSDNGGNSIPAQDEFRGFVRLPTEAEWEFAARGGSAVDANRFDQKTPYEGDLAKHEWYAGPRSSHGKLRGVGLLEPNPLGIHDMLGNCSELVSGLYQIEYVQGRAGGWVARGGDFRTEEALMRSSARTEQPPYSKDLKPARADSVGFRVALVTPVFTSINATRTLEAAWREHAASRAVPMPGTLSTAPLTEQTTVGLKDTEKILRELEAEVAKNASGSDVAKTKLNLLRSSFADVQANVNRSEQKFAEAGVRLASIGANQIAKSQRALQLYQKFKDDGSQVDAELQEDIDNEQKNLSDAVSTYVEALQVLARVDAAVADKTFDGWIEELRKRDIMQVTRATEVAKRHFRDFAKSKRLDMVRWSADLAAVIQEKPQGTSR
jgi:formylglycine-generating enzyme required for sulfatase activity